MLNLLQEVRKPHTSSKFLGADGSVLKVKRRSTRPEGFLKADESLKPIGKFDCQDVEYLGSCVDATPTFARGTDEFVEGIDGKVMSSDVAIYVLVAPVDDGGVLPDGEHALLKQEGIWEIPSPNTLSPTESENFAFNAWTERTNEVTDGLKLESVATPSPTHGRHSPSLNKLIK